MSENPYQPPQLPSDPPRPGRKQRPRSPFGYLVAALVGVLLGGTFLDSVMLWDFTSLGMILGAMITIVLYHFLPQYEPRDE